MVTIKLRMIAGRYHATPWGRNVNEGEVEWPPSPFRLARALVDVWKRRHPDLTQERVEAVLALLAGSPSFHLPPATASHTRHYMSANTKDPQSRQLILDAFVALPKDEPVLMVVDREPVQAVLDDLELLLDGLSFLGRSESWVDARVVTAAPEQPANCLPADVGAGGGEDVRLACLMPEEQYQNLPQRPEAKEVRKGRLRPTGKACTWLDAVCYSTADLLAEGWSDHPALSWVRYVRPESALRTSPRPLTVPVPDIRCVTYSISATVKPRVQETASFAERVRAILMGIHRRVVGGDPSDVSLRFSGKDSAGRPMKGHRHAFYLPMDLDGDGKLDHLRVQCSEPFTPSELEALDGLVRVWQKGRPEGVRLVLTGTHSEPPAEQAVSFVSATPYVTARHYRKGRGEYLDWLALDLARECAHHGLPEPTGVRWIGGTMGRGRSLNWWEFLRSRKGRPPLRGHGCMLTFDQPVSGPFALGAGCHFGLGLFVSLPANADL